MSSLSCSSESCETTTPTSMSTPSTATATLVPQQLNYGYSHHQNYQTPGPAFRTNPPTSSRVNLVADNPGFSSHGSSSYLSNAPNYSSYPIKVEATGLTMPPVQHAPVKVQGRKRGRSKEPDWDNFYKNGLPKEVIVIDDDSPPPSVSLDSRPLSSSVKQANRPPAPVNGAKHVAKRRKRDDVEVAYDAIYQQNFTTPHQIPSNSASTISTDRTASAINTTAATSLGSQNSHNADTHRANGAYQIDPPAGSLKRKRVTTRQQIANEARRKEIEVHGDAFSNYQAPPRPPLKAPDVAVPVKQDKSYTANRKVDDEDGHYIIVPDSDLTDRYQVVRLLGQGTFGKVVQAKDRRKNTNVAIKIIRSVQKYRDASRIELRVLATLKANDHENRNKCIHLRDCFDYRGHICIVTDLLGQSVFDFLKGNSFVPFPNSQIQHFARQLFTSVAFLHDLNLIHTDLKPENILLCHNAYQTFTYNRKIPSSSTNISRQAGQRRVLLDTEIRLIDFGSATFEDEYHSSVVSTRHYRAPEIILGLGWSFPCDIWSIGCILIEFFTGDALFQTHDNLEHLAMMEAVCNQKLPSSIISQVTKSGTRNGTGNPAAKYFKRNKLDYPTPDTTRASRRFVRAMKKLNEIIPSNNLFNKQFLDLLKRIFVYNAAERITAKEALQHPWFKEIATPDDGTEASKIKLEREQEAALLAANQARRNGYNH